MTGFLSPPSAAADYSAGPMWRRIAAVSCLAEGVTSEGSVRGLMIGLHGGRMDANRMRGMPTEFRLL
jgi:hypothetical protein